MGKLEKDVVKDIKETFGVWQMCGVVVFWKRLQVGTLQNNGRYVRFGEKGDPDFVSVIRNKQGNLSLIFAEAKRGDGKGKLSDEQEEFRDKYKNEKDVYWIEITDKRQLTDLLNEIGIDRTEEIKI